jgi:hypothetical protein
MEEHRQTAIEFFKWYGKKTTMFLEYWREIRVNVISKEIDEAMYEFEGATFDKLFDKFLESKSNENNQDKL